MSTWILVWLVLTVLSLAAVSAVVVGLVRQALVLSRSLGRFSEEVGSLADEIGQETDRVARHGGAGRPPGPRG